MDSFSSNFSRDQLKRLESIRRNCENKMDPGELRSFWRLPSDIFSSEYTPTGMSGKFGGKMSELEGKLGNQQRQTLDRMTQGSFSQGLENFGLRIRAGYERFWDFLEPKLQKRYDDKIKSYETEWYDITGEKYPFYRNVEGERICAPYANDIFPKMYQPHTIIKERVVSSDIEGVSPSLVKEPLSNLDLAGEQPAHSARTKDQSIDVCMETVKKNPFALKHMDKQTPEICLAAISQDYRSLSCVKEQTPVICLTAVKINGNALQFVREQTPQICMEAVQQTGDALQYVRNQTPELCSEAIKKSPLALKYVKKPSLELCVEAVRRDSRALNFVPETLKPAVWLHVGQNLSPNLNSKTHARNSTHLDR